MFIIILFFSPDLPASGDSPGSLLGRSRGSGRREEAGLLIARNLARCEPSDRKLDLMARESVRRLVAEWILHLENLLPRSITGRSQAMGFQSTTCFIFFQSDYPSVSIDDFASHEAADFWIRKTLGRSGGARLQRRCLHRTEGRCFLWGRLKDTPLFRLPPPRLLRFPTRIGGPTSIQILRKEEKKKPGLILRSLDFFSLPPGPLSSSGSLCPIFFLFFLFFLFCV